MSALVIGFGNALAADDGAGPAVIARLLERPLPPGVRAVDGGSDSLVLSTIWQGEPEVWLVDAFATGAPPGTVHRLGHEQLLALPQRSSSAHGLSLPESLRWMELSFPEMAKVRYRLWGIEPRSLAFLGAQCPEVDRAVALVAEEIARALARPEEAGAAVG